VIEECALSKHSHFLLFPASPARHTVAYLPCLRVSIARETPRISRSCTPATRICARDLVRATPWSSIVKLCFTSLARCVVIAAA
jgi:hypothetical protein